MNNYCRKESDRKYRESHRAQRRAYDRKRQQLPDVKARRNETARIRSQQAAIAFHGMPGLSISMQPLPRPKALTDLIIQEAEAFCVRWSVPLEFKFDTDVLEAAATAIRDNPFYPVVVPQEEMNAYALEHGITNPWHYSCYLSDTPKGSLKKKMSKLSSRLKQEARLEAIGKETKARISSEIDLLLQELQDRANLQLAES